MESTITFCVKKILFSGIFLLLLQTSYGQNLQSTLQEVWTDNSWRNHMLSDYTYDENSYLTALDAQFWTDEASWNDYYRNIYTNNPDGTPSNILMQVWTPEAWLNSQNDDMTYSPTGKITSLLRQQWVEGWQQDYFTSYTYDTSDYLSNSLYQIYNISTGLWENLYNFAYSNNADGTVNQIYFDTWNTSTLSWDQSIRITYSYNAAGKVLTELNEVYTGDWTNDHLNTFNYDVSGFLNETVYQSWSGSSWENNSRQVFLNDAAGNPLQMTYQFFDLSNVWVNDFRITMTYEQLGLPNFSGSILTLYPNPAKDFAVIKSSANETLPFTVVDAYGRMVSAGKIVDGNASVNLQGLQSGVYFIPVGNTGQLLRLVKD